MLGQPLTQLAVQPTSDDILDHKVAASGKVFDGRRSQPTSPVADSPVRKKQRTLSDGVPLQAVHTTKSEPAETAPDTNALAPAARPSETYSNGPLIASVGADGKEQAELQEESNVAENALIDGRRSDLSLNSSSPVGGKNNGLRAGSAESPGSRLGSSGITAMPSSGKGEILGPMVPMEILRRRKGPKTTDGHMLPPEETPDSDRSSKSTSSRSSNGGSNSSSTTGSFESSTSDSSIPDDHSRNQPIPSLSEDVRLADLVAADIRGQNSRKSRYRHETPQLLNPLSDMYSQAATLPLLPEIRGPNNQNNGKDSSFVPSVDRFSEIAYSQPRAPQSPGPGIETPRFAYNYQSGALPGYSMPMNGNPMQYGPLVILPANNTADMHGHMNVSVAPGDGHMSHNQSSSQQRNYHTQSQFRDLNSVTAGPDKGGHIMQPQEFHGHQPIAPYGIHLDGGRALGAGVNSTHNLPGNRGFSQASRVAAPALVSQPRQIAHPDSFDRKGNTNRDDLGLGDEERTYKCPHPGCDWSFVRSSDLKRHVRSHQKPSLKCPYWEVTPNCNRKGGMFHRLDVLKRHLRLVHLNRPSDGSSDGGQCQVCLREFTTTKDFIDHCESCARNVHDDLRHRISETQAEVD